MPPQIKIQREDIVRAAVELVRQEGAQSLGARAVAARLGCSTQPVFSNFANMEELRQAVILEAETVCEQYMRREIDRGVYPPYKATGMAYIQLASEEPELFRLLYMRERRNDEQTGDSAFNQELLELVQKAAHVAPEEAELFHLEMWIFVHGIAVMTATGYLSMDRELISRMISDIFKGLGGNAHG